MPLKVIGFDADDTLWHNERHFRWTQQRFARLLEGHATEEALAGKLLEAERRNLAFYGYGVKGFTLSMIETALDVTNGDLDGDVIRGILDAGREMLAHPVEPLPHAAETLGALSGDYRLVLVTKGDLFDQERKLAASGLGDHFHGVEIVSEKTRAVYETVFARHGARDGSCAMVGNSLKSDVIPAIEAGGWGIHVPHELTWELEHAEAPVAHPRFREIANLADLPGLLQVLR